jgi:hypothetical protein
VSDHVAGYICAALGLGVGAYTIVAWRTGRIRWQWVSKRSDEPFSFWSAIVSAALWSAICAGVGIYWILH